MKEPGLNPISPLQRAALFDLIGPQLRQIRDAIIQIEAKVGTDSDSWERSEAIATTLSAVMSSYHCIPCAIFSWVQLKDTQIQSHSTSYLNSIFLEKDLDSVLSVMVEQMVRIIGAERFEIVERAQKGRE